MDITKKYSKEEYDQIVRQNEILKRENKYLKQLTNSKRFKFAAKIANGYNEFFPKDTKRRRLLEKTGHSIGKIFSARQIRKKNKLTKKILSLVESYDKIIVLNSISWDIKLKQRPHHLADEFCKLGYFVIYLEYDNPVKKFRRIKDGLIVINNESFIIDLPAKHKGKYYFLTPNNLSTEYEVIKKIKDNGYQIIYDYLDEFHEDIAGDLNIQMKVWDNLSELKPVVCLATATKLYNDLKEHLGEKQTIITSRNAVNVDHFDYSKNNFSSPIDLKPALKNNKPIVGFYGALAPWIDFELLNNIADKHKEWNFVYLGVNYNGAAVDLRKKSNVFNLGAKDYEDLPKYAKFFDCAIIPFVHGEIAKATSPVKLFEYMAAGLPTVCTRDLEECYGYDHVYISKNDIEFEQNIEKAIKNHTDENVRMKLLEQAKENTWAKRAEDIDKTLSD